MIGNNENNDDFHLKEYFYQLLTINNQNIFDVKREIKPYFSVDYTKCISANLASSEWFYY